MDWKFKYNLFDLSMFEIDFLEAENFSLSKCVSNQIQYKDKKIIMRYLKKKLFSGSVFQQRKPQI